MNLITKICPLCGYKNHFLPEDEQKCICCQFSLYKTREEKTPIQTMLNFKNEVQE